MGCDMYLYGLFSGCVPDSAGNLRECFLKLITFEAINIICDHETMQATRLLFFLISVGRKYGSGTQVKQLQARGDLKRMTPLVL